MQDFFYRTEDIKPDQVLDFYVETKTDRDIVDSLKSKNPAVLVGSRGVGKSFLLRVAEQELSACFDKDRVLPIYVTFSKGILLNTVDTNQFHHWMLARICARIIRTLRQKGLLTAAQSSITALTGGADIETESEIEKIANLYEASWKNQNQTIDTSAIPSIDNFKDTIEDICGDLDINRFAFFFDEVAHIFRPEQQRQFFTLFRDLRSPYITCNAAVYPGVTSYGGTFQPTHDATFLYIARDILSSDYVENMREIVEKQADSQILTNIMQHGEYFAILCYAAHGNPRLLLKTLNRCPRLGSAEVNNTIKEFYRADIWTEHSGLVNSFSGHKALIDWGRNFIESVVLPEINKKNNQYMQQDKKTSCYFWIHRDAPESIKEAIKLLTYTGIVNGDTEGIKATRAEIGTRYAVSLGCLFALESIPVKTSFDIAKNLTIKRMTEFGAKHAAYNDIQDLHPDVSDPDWSKTLHEQLQKSIDILDVTDWQKKKLNEAKLNTIGKILELTAEDLKKIYYVGDVRSRRIYGAAQAAVYEYLSG